MQKGLMGVPESIIMNHLALAHEAQLSASTNLRAAIERIEGGKGSSVYFPESDGLILDRILGDTTTQGSVAVESSEGSNAAIKDAYEISFANEECTNSAAVQDSAQRSAPSEEAGEDVQGSAQRVMMAIKNCLAVFFCWCRKKNVTQEDQRREKNRKKKEKRKEKKLNSDTKME